MTFITAVGNIQLKLYLCRGSKTNRRTNYVICIFVFANRAVLIYATTTLQRVGEHMQHESSYNLLNLSEVGIQIICVASKPNSKLGHNSTTK